MIKVEIDVQSFRTAIEEFRRITPRRFSIALNRATRRIANTAMEDFSKTVDTWKSDIQFELKYKLNPSHDVEEFAIYNSDLVYKWVNYGTKAHKIPMKREQPVFDKNGKIVPPKRLKFMNGYNAKTQAGQLDSSGGGPFGEYIYAKEVMHPGIEARNFDDLVINHIYDIMDDIIFEELDRAYERQRGKS